MAIEQARARCGVCEEFVLATREKVVVWYFYLIYLLFWPGIPIAMIMHHRRRRHREPWRCPICGLDVVPDGWTRKRVWAEGGYNTYELRGPDGPKESYTVPAVPASAKASQDWEKVVQKSRALPAAPKSVDEIDRALDEKLGG